MNHATDNLHYYLVGGAVRDLLLGRAEGDRDWVVVGATAAQMRARGFTQVGRDFPVFLHPQTHEEYALARTERKHGHGHKGFEVHAAPDVTLEQDLQRRDLTINAIAQAPDGSFIDPFNGQQDIEQRVLRHVSGAFVEDPLRVLRVARFAAQMPAFTVAPETLALMRDIVQSGELRALSAERVWQETQKALNAPRPERFFEVMDQCQGMADWFEELQAVPLDFIASDAQFRFAALPLDEPAFKRLGARLKVPGRYLQLAMDRLKWGHTVRDWRNTDAAQLLDGLTALKALHDEVRLRQLTRLLAAMVPGLDDELEVDALLGLCQHLRTVRVTDETVQGAAYGRALRQLQLSVIEAGRQAA